MRRDDVIDQQAKTAQSDTSSSRAAWRAGPGSRSVGTARTTVRTTAGGEQPIRPGSPRY